MAAATRLFVAQDLTPDAAVAATPEQAHFLFRVLRLSTGAELKLFNGRDGEWSARIADIGKTRAEFRLIDQTRDQISSTDLWLAFAPLKKSQTDFVVEKATELGVSRMIPVLTERTQTERVRTERLRATAIGAAEQCERLDIPDIAEPMPLKALVDDWPSDRCLFVCAETGPAEPLADIAQRASETAVGFVTGPEGGYSAAELDFLQRSSLVVTVSLGPRILRAETAALAALAVWQAVAGDGRHRPPRG